MRRALLLVLLLSLAGCAADQGGNGVATAGGTPAGGASSAPAADPGADGLKFAQCMRANGMSWFKDPEPNQRGIRIAVPPGQDKTKVDAAMKACKEFLPNGGEPPKMDAAQIARAREMSRCMRENGVPNFPDPGPNGEMRIDGRKLGTGPGQPDFDAAEKACARFQPDPPPGGDERGTAAG